MTDQPTEQQTTEIINALEAGQKIEAIKIYREATGKGLKEAKDFIDALTPKLIEQDPERYGKLAKQQGGGCASVVVLVVALAAVVGWMVT